MLNIPAEVMVDVLKFLPSAHAMSLARVSRQSHAIVKRDFAGMKRRRGAGRSQHWLGAVRLTAKQTATAVTVQTCHSFAGPDTFTIDTVDATEKLEPLFGVPVRVQHLHLDAEDGTTLKHWTSAIRHHSLAFERLHDVSMKLGGEIETPICADLFALFNAIATPFSVSLTFRRAFNGALLNEHFLLSCPNIEINFDANCEFADGDMEKIVATLYNSDETIKPSNSPWMRREMRISANKFPAEQLLMCLVWNFDQAQVESECRLRVRLNSREGLRTASARRRNAHTGECLNLTVEVDSNQATILAQRQK